MVRQSGHFQTVFYCLCVIIKDLCDILVSLTHCTESFDLLVMRS